MTESIDFRRTIQKDIDRLGVSIARVARRADCNHQTLYNYLSGRSKSIHSDILQRVLNVLQELEAPEKPGLSSAKGRT